MFLTIPGLGEGKFAAPSILNLCYLEDGDKLRRRSL